MTPVEIAAQIRALSLEQMIELKQILEDDPGWGEAVGVREPRWPVPPNLEQEATHELPADYAESAE